MELSKEQVAKLIAAHSNLIVTCRPGVYDEERRKALLLSSIKAGVAYVDIEVESSDEFKTTLMNAARSKGCKTIISYHNFEKTPERAEFEHLLKWCGEFEPDIIKIACLALTKQDNARLFGLLDTTQPMIVIGMGEQGKITRVVAPLLGSFCTFVTYETDKDTAPGQLSKKEVERLTTELTQL